MLTRRLEISCTQPTEVEADQVAAQARRRGDRGRDGRQLGGRELEREIHFRVELGRRVGARLGCVRRQRIGDRGVQRARFAQLIGQALALEGARREPGLQFIDLGAHARRAAASRSASGAQQGLDPLLPARALGGERSGLVGPAALVRQQLVEVGLGLGVELGVFAFDAHAVEFGIVIGHFADEDRGVVEIGGGSRKLPLVGFRQAMGTRELDVLDE